MRYHLVYYETSHDYLRWHLGGFVVVKDPNLVTAFPSPVHVQVVRLPFLLPNVKARRLRLAALLSSVGDFGLSLSEDGLWD